MKLTIALILLSVLLATMKRVEMLGCERHNNRTLRTFIIDLDRPPREHFKETTLAFKPYILKFLDSIKGRLNDYKLLRMIKPISGKFLEYFHTNYAEEIMGIAEVLGISLNDAVTLNIFYEMTAYCTSVVAQNKEGHIIHGRNLDYYYSDILQDMTFIAKFRRSGKLLYSTAQTAGFVGVLTAHKYNKFTLSINERDSGGWLNNLLVGLLDRTALPMFFMMREVMENAETFDEAVKMLQKRHLIAGAYYIVGGVRPDQGVIITRNQLRAVDTWRLNSSSTQADKWYLFETNYDHWKDVPIDDDRRTPGRKAMNDITQANINMTNLMDVLSIWPVCNNETVYSVVMSARERFETGFQIVMH